MELLQNTTVVTVGAGVSVVSSVESFTVCHESPDSGQRSVNPTDRQASADRLVTYPQAGSQIN